MLVPVEETEWIQTDPLYLSSGKEDDLKFKYVLGSRDYFDSEQLYEGDIAAISRANTLTATGEGAEEDLNRISITCSSKCCVLDTTEQPMWFRCDQKSSTNVNFAVKLGQVNDGQGFQFCKSQLNVLKELADLGLTNLPTHYCEHCNAEAQAKCKPTATFKDVAKLCFNCSVQHRIEHPEHTLGMVLPLQLFQQLLKRSERMEYLARIKLAELQEQIGMRHMANLASMFQDLVLGGEDAFESHEPAATDKGSSKKKKEKRKKAARR